MLKAHNSESGSRISEKQHTVTTSAGYHDKFFIAFKNMRVRRILRSLLNPSG